MPKQFLSRNKFCIEQHWKSQKIIVETTEKRVNSNKIIEKLLTIFERKDITVEEFMIGDNFMELAHRRNQNLDPKKLMEVAFQFLKVVEEKGITLRINHLRVQYPVEDPLEFLKNFDPLSMKSIMMAGHTHWGDEEAFSELMEVPQWPNLKILAIEPMIRAELGRFHGVDSLCLVFQHLEPVWIADLIKNFLTKQPSPRTCFIIKGLQIFEKESFLRTVIQEFFGENHRFQYDPDRQLFVLPFNKQWMFAVFQKRERLCGGFKLRVQDLAYNQFILRLGSYSPFFFHEL
ncbi:hypothetical protein B9Z55_011190 [Caenorhabditis nigoni]|uniref:DUF38 domain-containing protein n=1 Tax=Caenorhabditis nigoni TaxID=1611254 RepID=A0A2G5UJ12_9PELO|nr:hypothetical protein B9Z55_011190 [Caenorhabditis nigoni]